VTALSGRGVGLDVVKHRVEGLHGSVGFEFTAGAGTCFTLALPLTLSSLRALLITAAGQTYAVPTASIDRLVRVEPEALTAMHGREVLVQDGRPVPVAHLAEVLGSPVAPPRQGRIAIAVLAAGARRAAIAVDELLTEQECVVKSLGPRLRRVRHVTGATVLPTGRVALILSSADVIDTVLGRVPQRRLVAAEAPAPAPRRRLVVADDSLTTRTLEKSILEAAGYEVVTAPDGAEAWRILQDRGADLLVADVEMPRMDGFALCEAVRASKRLRDLPIVLVTALESERDRARGLEVGADAYLTKGAFDQRQLLDTIAQLL
jgi:two-component system chemotaxis sensor kinase CheA